MKNLGFETIQVYEEVRIVLRCIGDQYEVHLFYSILSCHLYPCCVHTYTTTQNRYTAGSRMVPWTFIIGCKSVVCHENWYSSKALVQVAMNDRFIN